MSRRWVCLSRPWTFLIYLFDRGGETMGALSMLPLSAITFSDYIVVDYMILTCLVIFDRLFPQQPSKGGRYWLARVELLKKRAIIVGDEVISYVQTAGQLYDNAKADEALKIVHQAKMICESNRQNDETGSTCG